MSERREGLCHGQVSEKEEGGGPQVIMADLGEVDRCPRGEKVCVIDKVCV